MLTFATKKLSTGANEQKDSEDALRPGWASFMFFKFLSAEFWSTLSCHGFEYFWEFWVWVKLDLGLGIRVSGFHDSSIELCLQKGTLLPPIQVSICASREGLWKVNLILRKQPFDFPSPKC